MSARPLVALFFDARCGPCTFFARVTRGLCRRPIQILPLDGPEADRVLGAMALDVRFGSFHLVTEGETRSGSGAMPLWAGLIAGGSGRRLAERAPPVERALRFAYLRLWRYRNRHGCSSVPEADRKEVIRAADP